MVIVRDLTTETDVVYTQFPRDQSDTYQNVLYLGFSPDSSKLGVITDQNDSRNVRVFSMLQDSLGHDMMNGHKIGNSQLAAIDFSPDGKWMVFADHQAMSKLRAVRPTLEAGDVHEVEIADPAIEGCNSVHATPDWKYLLSCHPTGAGGASNIILWEGPKRTVDAADSAWTCWPFGSGITEEDGAVVEGEEPEVEKKKKKEVATWDIHAESKPLQQLYKFATSSAVLSMCLSPEDGTSHFSDSPTRYLAVGTEGGYIDVHSLPTEISPPHLVKHYNLALCPLIHRLQTISADGKISTEPVSSIDFNHDGSQIASLCDDGSLTIWDVTCEGTVMTSNTAKERDATLPGRSKCVRFSPWPKWRKQQDISVALTAGKDKVIMREVKSERHLYPAEHKGKAFSVAGPLDTTQHYVASAGTDGIVQIYEVQDGTLTHVNKGIQGRAPGGTE